MTKTEKTILIALAHLAAAAFATPAYATTAFAADGDQPSSLSFTVKAEATERLGSLGEEFLDRGLSPSLGAAIQFDAGVFSLVAEASAQTDGKYAPILADTPTGTLGDIYAMMQEGGIRAKPGNFTFEVGRFRHYDEINSPYSLAVNGRGLSAFLMCARYEDERFFYETRWISLNHDSSMNTDGWPESDFDGFPDRGANLKTYGMKFSGGEMRAGFQDIAVYARRNFDAEYFLSPVPQYLIQYISGQGGRPWSTGYDDNSIMGIFWDWRRPGQFAADAQVLVDDFGAFGIGEWVNNPWQLAATAGGSLETPAGSFGLHVAGATRYTFEPRQVGDFSGATLAEIQSTAAYGYTYYPDTRFDIDSGSAGFQPRAIAIEDNQIGYLYGQNNLAMRINWAKDFGDLDLGAAFEFRLAGSNSPANAWGDLLRDPQDGTHWLDDPVLEKRFMLSLDADWKRGAWTLYGSIAGGIAFDALELRAPEIASSETSVAPADSGIWIYAPVKGNTKPLLTLTLGASLRLDTERR